MDKEETIKMIRQGSERLGKLSNIMVSIDWLYDNGYEIIEKPKSRKRYEAIPTVPKDRIDKNKLKYKRPKDLDFCKKMAKEFRDYCLYVEKQFEVSPTHLKVGKARGSELTIKYPK